MHAPERSQVFSATDNCTLCLFVAPQTLNTQVEAALQSGLNFKDRFRTNSRKRLLLPPADADADELGEQSLDDEGGWAGPLAKYVLQTRHCAWRLLCDHATCCTAVCLSHGVTQQQVSCKRMFTAPTVVPRHATLLLKVHVLPHAVTPLPSADQRGPDAVEQDSQQQHMQQQPDRQPQQQQQQQRQQPAGKPGKPSLPLAGGLKLTVGSNLETGEWKTGGVWLKKDKAEHEAVPSNLQIMSADDLVKVGASWLQLTRHHLAKP
jgi:hypothetical protein